MTVESLERLRRCSDGSRMVHQRGDRQQGRPGDRAPGHRGRAELAEAAAADVRAARCAARSARPWRPGTAGRSRAGPGSPARRLPNDPAVTISPIPQAELGSAHRDRGGLAQLQREQRRRARARRAIDFACMTRTNFDAHAPSSSAASSGICTSRSRVSMSTADRQRGVETALLELAAERDEARERQVGDAAARRGLAGDAVVVEQPGGRRAAGDRAASRTMFVHSLRTVSARADRQVGQFAEGQGLAGRRPWRPHPRRSRWRDRPPGRRRRARRMARRQARARPPTR